MNKADIARLAREEHEFRKARRHRKARLRGYLKRSTKKRNERPRPPRGDR